MDIRDKINSGEYDVPSDVWVKLREITNKVDKITWHRHIREIEQANNMQFKNDLFEELNITNHPKREKLFELAWEHGHGAGLDDVVSYAEDFVELIR